MGVGLQHKTVDELAAELDIPSHQILGLFNKTMRKCVQFLNGVLEKSVEVTFIQPKPVEMNPTVQTVKEDLEEAAEVRF